MTGRGGEGTEKTPPRLWYVDIIPATGKEGHPGTRLRDPGLPNEVTTSHDSAADDDQEQRRLVLDLTRLDEVTADDEEEINRFRSYAAATPAGRGSGHRLGRMFGHRPPAERRAAS